MAESILVIKNGKKGRASFQMSFFRLSQESSEFGDMNMGKLKILEYHRLNRGTS